MKTMKVSEWIKTRGLITQGTKVVHIMDLGPHGKKGDFRVVIDADGDRFYLSDCRRGPGCGCSFTGYSLMDVWFAVVVEDSISDEEAAGARPIPDTASVLDDMRRMFGIQ